MSNKKIFEDIFAKFKAFGKELGFVEWFDDIHDYYASSYIRKEHALELSVEYPDASISMDVIRLENNQIPENGYSVGADGRRIRIGIDEIYDDDRPDYPGDPYSVEALYFSLEQEIAIIRNNPKLLFDFMANIEENTTVQKTKEQMRKLIQKRLDETERDYRSGKLDRDFYEEICKQLQSDLTFWSECTPKDSFDRITLF